MPEEVKLNEEEGVIEVSSHGVVTKHDIAHSIDIVLEIKCNKGVDKVLVDTREQTSMPNTIEIVELFIEKFPDNMKVAIITSEKQPTKRDIDFAEVVAANRFFDKFKMFPSKEQALAFLNQSPVVSI